MERGEAAGYRTKADALIENLRAHAWARDHFICGINDAGLKIGAHESADANLFLNMQTWAVLSGAVADGNELFDLVEHELATPVGYVLCTPACRQQNPRIGMFSFMTPGTCENGAVYCHGNAFKIVAACALGRAEEAYATLKKILPGNPENPDSGVEPCAVTNQYLEPENPHGAGEANGTWITGTAGWICRAVTEHLLGLQAGYDELHLNLGLPAAWPEVKIRRVFRGKVYNITLRRSSSCGGLALRRSASYEGQVLRRSDTPSLTDNGQEITGDLLPLGPEKTEHNIAMNI
jgi:cellobionic acid phosphorylase